MFGVTTRACGSSSAHSICTSVVVQQSRACRRREHWIDDDQRQLELPDRGGHRFDDRRVAEHAGLCRVDLDVAGDGFDLRRDEIGGERRGFDDAGVLWAVIAVIALAP